MWGGKQARNKRASKSSSSSSSSYEEYDDTEYEMIVTIPEAFESRYSIWGTYLKECTGYKTGAYRMELHLLVLINPEHTNYRSYDIMRYAKSLLSEISVARKYEININLQTDLW